MLTVKKVNDLRYPVPHFKIASGAPAYSGGKLFCSVVSDVARKKCRSTREVIPNDFKRQSLIAIQLDIIMEMFVREKSFKVIFNKTRIGISSILQCTVL